MLLIILPWSDFWEHNYFAATLPPLRSVASNNFVRGGVTGLGVVNLVLGLAELAMVFASRKQGSDGTDTGDLDASPGAALGNGSERSL